MAEISGQMHAYSQRRGAFFVAFSGMLYGMMGYLAVQLFHQHFSVSAMLFWRFFTAMLWMLISSVACGKNIFSEMNTHPVVVKSIINGVISYSIGTACFFLACKHIGTGLAMVIFFSFPVFVTLFAWVLSNWQMNKYAFASLLAVIIGLLLLKGVGRHALDAQGIGFAVFAALLYAVYVYGNQHSVKMLDSRLLTFLICLGNSLVFLIISCATKSFIVPNTFHLWFYVLAIGILATALPIQLLLDGLRYVNPVKASILSVLEPVVTVIIGLAFLNETISYVQSIGVVIIILGAILIQFEKMPKPINEEAISK